MRTEKMTRLRECVRSYSDIYGYVNHHMIFRALGAEDESEKARIRRRTNQLVKTGELTRKRPGVFFYNAEAAPARGADKLSRIWRAVRSAKPGFAAHDLARISGAEYSYVIKYLQALENENYIRRSGKKGNNVLYRGTEKLRNKLTTFMPPRPISDPFAEERKSVHSLVGLFMLSDLYRPAARKRIVENCRTLLARFEHGEGAEETEDNHVRSQD